MREEFIDKTGDVWFVYDGECPLCKTAAKALRIKKAVGKLNLINAREDKNHSVIQEINRAKINLDKGMVIKFDDKFYHGDDALGVMAFLGTNVGWFNRINYILFRSRLVSRLIYPFMRGSRNVLLLVLGVKQIKNLE